MSEPKLNDTDIWKIKKLVNNYNALIVLNSSEKQLKRYFSNNSLYRPGGEDITVFVVDSFEVTRFVYIKEWKAWYVYTKFHIYGTISIDGFFPEINHYEEIGLGVVKENEKWKIYIGYNYKYLNRKGALKWVQNFNDDKNFQKMYKSVMYHLGEKSK